MNSDPYILVKNYQNTLIWGYSNKLKITTNHYCVKILDLLPDRILQGCINQSDKDCHKTAKGIKPVVPYQHRFKNFYLFGAYSPINGDHYILELPYCNTDCFQQYLNGMSTHHTQEFKLLILDNGAFHKTKRREIPPNIGLKFLPPYSPELNPAEMIWRYIKDRLANKIYEGLERLSDKLLDIIRNLSPEIVLSITGWDIYKNYAI